MPLQKTINGSPRLIPPKSIRFLPMKKVIRRLIVFLVIVLIIGFIGLNNIAPYAIVQPYRASLATTPEQLGLEQEPLNLQTKDSVQLAGYWIKSQQDSAKGIIILVHGIGGCKEHFLGLAKELSQQGIESIVFDGRAHGASGGQYCTYGFYEKEDIQQIVDKIKTQAPHLKIGIWGNSLGGAIAIQALELDPRIEFGLIESTFTDLSQIVLDYKKRLLKGFGIQALSNFALKRAGEIAQFDPQQVKPIASVKNIEQPVFLAHGDADQNIKVAYGKQLFQALKSQDKELAIVKGAGHFSLYQVGGQQYKNKIMRFIYRQLE